MQEDSFVSTDKGTGQRADDECSSDGSDEHSVNTVEEGEASEESDENEGSEANEASEESDESEESEESEGSEGSDGSDESQMTDESQTTDESQKTDDSDESDETDESDGSDESQTTDETSEKKVTGKPTAGKRKNEIPKRHRSQRCRGTSRSGGDSATSISPGSFEYHDCDHSSDPASVANSHPPERLSKRHFNSWMPSRDASLISRRSSSEIEKKLTGDKGRELRRRDGDCLRDIKLRSFHVQHIAVGARGSNGLGRGMGQGESRSVIEFLLKILHEKG
ncbi:hypothetical protein IWW34DRAFT_642675 [Fusarium oxysporum f. sp. albedinis]|nr:hypothetical protein IWW34DRAFT_642675 [Fusarium oxysporum f. sp. albedinis]